MPGRELADRVVAFLREQEDGADATTIAREFLRLTDPSGDAAASLVRAVLGRDPRFVEKPRGMWRRAAASPAAAIGPPVLLVALEIPAGAGREPWLWRVAATGWNETGRPLEHTGPARSDALCEMLPAMAVCPVATDRAGALARWIGAQERLHAFPETDPVLIDLAAWGALLGESAPATEPDETGARLAALARRLERVAAAAAARGLDDWAAVATAPALERERARAEVWDPPRALTPEMLEALPEEPGIYRFFARDRSILYVGKSRNLRRRVASYFRPPEGRGTKREALLREIHRLEIAPAGSELEALIRESQEIARSRPPWNVQVRLDPDPPEYPLGERDLLLALPGPPATLFLLAGVRVGMTRLPAEPDRAALAELLRAFFADGAIPEGVEEIPPPERVLVRRWMGWSPGGIAVSRLIDFATFRELAEAVALSRAPAVGDPPVRLRG
jgi:hypothetical protein